MGRTEIVLFGAGVEDNNLWDGELERIDVLANVRVMVSSIPEPDSANWAEVDSRTTLVGTGGLEVTADGDWLRTRLAASASPLPLPLPSPDTPDCPFTVNTKLASTNRAKPFPLHVRSLFRDEAVVNVSISRPMIVSDMEII